MHRFLESLILINGSETKLWSLEIHRQSRSYHIGYLLFSPIIGQSLSSHFRFPGVFTIFYQAECHVAIFLLQTLHGNGTKVTLIFKMWYKTFYQEQVVKISIFPQSSPLSTVINPGNSIRDNHWRYLKGGKEKES